MMSNTRSSPADTRSHSSSSPRRRTGSSTDLHQHPLEGRQLADTFNLAEARDVLARTPSTLAALLGDLSDSWLTSTEGDETWSPRDVVAHLTDLEDSDWMVRSRQIINEGEAGVFAPIDRERFKSLLAGHSISQLLELFAARRARNLAELDAMNLAAADLARAGTHPSLGAVTLEQLLASWVVHDMTHISQIVRVMAKRYDGAVGPWKEYLSILSVKR